MNRNKCIQISFSVIAIILTLSLTFHLGFTNFNNPLHSSNGDSPTAISLDSYNFGFPSNRGHFNNDDINFGRPRPLIGPPKLLSPENGAILTDSTPTLLWSSVTGVIGYSLQVDDNPYFSSPQSFTLSKTSYTFASPLASGRYYWRVASIGGGPIYFSLQHQSSSKLSSTTWSLTWSFIISVGNLDPPSLLSPRNNAIISDNRPTFDCSDVIGAKNYCFQIATDSSFSNANNYICSDSKFTPSSPLNDGTYYWRVKVQSYDGTWGSWSSYFKLTIDTTGPVPPPLIAPADNEFINDPTPKFQWNSVSDAVQYQIQVYYIDDTGSPKIIVNQATTSTVITCPTTLLERPYCWSVRASDSLGNWGVWSLPNEFVVDLQPPGIPLILSPNNFALINTSNPLLSWREVPDAEMYQIEVGYYLENINDDTNALLTITDIYDTSIVISSSLYDGRYWWRVRAIDKAGNYGSWSIKGYFVIDTTPPEPPELLYPGLVYKFNKESIRPIGFTWSAPEEDLFYELSISTSINFDNAECYFTTDNNYTLELGDGTYYWRVRAKDLAGNWGEWSQVHRIIIDTTPPDVPNIISPSGLYFNPKTHAVVWEHVDDAEKYRIEIFEGSFCIENNITTETSYYITKISVFNERYIYTINITAIDDLDNEGAPASVKFIPDFTPPDSPTLEYPEIGDIINNRMPIFTWSRVTNVEEYQIIISRNSDLSFAIVNDSVEHIYTRYTLKTPLLAEGRYYWAVRAIDAADNPSNWSKGYFDLDVTPPSSPDLLEPANDAFINDNTPTFRWKIDENSDAVIFEIQISTNSFFTTILLSNITSALSYCVTEAPLADGTYYWRVRARDLAGNWGEWSDCWSVTVDTHPPTAPMLVNPENGTILLDANNITFEWTSTAETLEYHLQLSTDPTFSNLVLNITTNEHFYVFNFTFYDSIWYWRVRGRDHVNYSPWSSTFTFETQTNLSAPQILSPPNGARFDVFNVTFNWTEVYGAVGYEIVISRVSYFDNLKLIHEFLRVNTTDTMYNMTFSDEGEYLFKVRAFNNSKFGNYSTEISITISIGNYSKDPLLSSNNDARVSLNFLVLALKRAIQRNKMGQTFSK